MGVLDAGFGVRRVKVRGEKAATRSPCVVKKLKLLKRRELSILGVALAGWCWLRFVGAIKSRISTNGLGAHPGLRHGDRGPGAAGAEGISGRRKSDPEGQPERAPEALRPR